VGARRAQPLTPCTPSGPSSTARRRAPRRLRTCRAGAFSAWCGGSPMRPASATLRTFARSPSGVATRRLYAAAVAGSQRFSVRAAGARARSSTIWIEKSSRATPCWRRC
ncbi:unnamed protein product, partial [Prorocentrum cordatum]